MTVVGYGCPLENVTALSAIGSGFAHEVGNPIAGALAVLQLASRRTREPETREHLANLHGELTRAARMIREVADFTRAEAPGVAVDVNEVVRGALTLARYAHEDVHLLVVFEPSPHVLPLDGGRDALLHVLLHLLMHAYDTAQRETDRLRVVSRAQAGENVVIIERTGRDDVDSGLAPCGCAIAAELGGTVAVEATPDGSCVTLRLPVPARYDAPTLA
jgi:signal transduction histidine kinase